MKPIGMTFIYIMYIDPGISGRTRTVLHNRKLPKKRNDSKSTILQNTYHKHYPWTMIIYYIFHSKLIRKD